VCYYLVKYRLTVYRRPAYNLEMGCLQSLPEAHFHILLALADGDKHGYSIMQDVAATTGGRTRLSPGTLYGAIHRLLEHGLITEVRTRVAAEQRRRYYSITPEGRKAATAEVERLRVLLQKARSNGLTPKRSQA
jgi:DNA-binding PadR family transcriptional regulator